MRPWGYHLTSLVFHVVNMVVFYHLALVLLERSGRGHAPEPDVRRAEPIAAALAVALFAVHPLRVEVVAWASCQPYLLCSFFAMHCALAYLHSADASTPSARRSWLAGSWLFFVMAVLSKAAAVPLPAVLLILDVYPLRRLGPGPWFGPEARRIYGEMLFFVVPCAGFIALTYHARVSDSGATPLEAFGLAPRVVQALSGITFYVVKTVFPFGLTAYYPLPVLYEELFHWPFAHSVVAAILATAAVLVLAKRWPGVAAAWAVYLVFLAPNLGLVWSGTYIAADRYSYLATMGGFVLLAGALSRLACRPRRWRWAIRVGLALIVILTALTWRQCRTWRSSSALWLHARCAHRPELGNTVANLNPCLPPLASTKGGSVRRRPCSAMSRGSSPGIPSFTPTSARSRSRRGNSMRPGPTGIRPSSTIPIRSRP